MKQTVTDAWQLGNVLTKKQSFKFAKYGCSVHELEFPRMIQSKALLSALKKSPCPIKRIVFINEAAAVDKKKMKKLIEVMLINKSIRSIRLMEMVKADPTKTKLDAFFSHMLALIKAMKNIKTIELSYFGEDPAITRFFDSLKEINYIRLKIQLCNFSLQTLLAYLTSAKYQPILKLTNMEQDFITEVLQNQAKNRTLKDLVLTDMELTVEQWKILLSLSNVNSISILRCAMSLSTWKQISDLVLANKFIKSLDFVDRTLTLDHFSDLLSKSKYLQRFGKKKKEDSESIENKATFTGLAQALKNNSTLTYLDIRGSKCHFKPLAEILTHNTTLRTLCVDLDVACSDSKAKGFWKFIDALKSNTTLTALKFDHIYYRKYRTMGDAEKDPFKVDPLQAFAEVLKVNRTLIYISRLEANEDLIRNRKEHDRVKWNCIWFVHMIRRNVDLFRQLPIEVWLNIIGQLGVPGLDKILLE